MATGLGNATFTVKANTAPLAQSMQAAQRSTQAAANAIQGTLTGASHAGTRSLLQLAYAADDVQYGFRAIVNNIPQALMFLGPGIAGAAGLAAVAISQLINHWNDMSATMQAAWEGGSSDRLRVLADRAETAAQAFEKMRDAATDAENKGAKLFGEAVVEGGTEKIRKSLTDTLMATGQGAEKRDTDGLLAGLARGPKDVAEWILGHKLPSNLKEQSEAQYAETAKMAGDLLGQAQQPGEAGKVARGRINQAIKANPGGFSEEFKTRFDASDPAVQEKLKQQRLEAEGARNDRKMVEKLNAQKIADQQQQAKWEADGRRNERDFENKMERKREQAENEKLRAASRELFKVEREMPRLSKIGTVAGGQSMGIMDFIKNTQAGALGNTRDKQLDALHQQVELLKQIKASLNGDLPQLTLGSKEALAVGPN